MSSRIFKNLLAQDEYEKIKGKLKDSHEIIWRGCLFPEVLKQLSQEHIAYSTAIRTILMRQTNYADMPNIQMNTPIAQTQYEYIRDILRKANAFYYTLPYKLMEEVIFQLKQEGWAHSEEVETMLVDVSAYE